MGKARDAVTAPRLAELNSYVPIHVLPTPLSAAAISNYQLVVLTSSDHQTRLDVNAMTRQAGVKFIAAETVGLFG